jgi:transposase
MLMLPPGSRVFLATSCVDRRKGIDGLSALVRSQFGQDPLLSGTLFVFFSKRADRVRVLYWDRDGYVLTMKLEQGRYRIPWRSEQGHVVVEAAEEVRRGRAGGAARDGARAAGPHARREFRVAQTARPRPP